MAPMIHVEKPSAKATLRCPPPLPVLNDMPKPPASRSSLGMPRNVNCATHTSQVKRPKYSCAGGTARPRAVMIPHRRTCPLMCSESGLTIKPLVHRGAFHSFAALGFSSSSALLVFRKCVCVSESMAPMGGKTAFSFLHLPFHFKIRLCSCFFIRRSESGQSLVQSNLQNFIFGHFDFHFLLHIISCFGQ